MMTAVLTRLTEPGQPLDLFRREMLPLGQPSKIDRHYAINAVVACFVAHEFKDEYALKKVTRDSIKTVIMDLLKDRFLVMDDGQLTSMAETATRLAVALIRELHAEAQQPGA